MRLSAFAAFFITPLILVIKSQPPRVSHVSRIPCVSIPRATRPNGLRARVLTGLGLACALASTTLSAPAWAQVSDSDDTALMNLIAQASERVMLADTVARYKWAKKESITDPVREKALLASVARQAPNYGVEPQLAQTFFRDQIEANKVVQQGLIDGWHVAAPPPGPVPDLASSTRPQYDRLTITLLTGLARVESVRRADDCSVRLSRSLRAWKELRTVDTLHAQALNRAFEHLCAGGVGAVG